MKIIYNKIIPFKGFKAINLFGVLFVRLGVVLQDHDIRHEEIHTVQMKEMLYVFFYLFYLIEWLIKLIKYGKNSYRNISFEREAYTHQCDYHRYYLSRRLPWSWVKFIIK